MLVRQTCLLLIVMLGRSELGLGQDWNSFRNGGESTIEGEVVTDWGPEKNLRWQRETDGYGQSAPVIREGHVVLTSVIGPMKEKCCVTCVSLDTGRTQWQSVFTAGQKAPSNYAHSRAAPTPVLDADGVVAFFESGDLIALDWEGKTKWQRNLVDEYGAIENGHGFGSSPTQSDSAIFLNVDHRGQSYLLCLEKADGERLDGGRCAMPQTPGRHR